MRKTFRKKGVAFALALAMLCSLGWTGNAHAEEAAGAETTEMVEAATALDALQAAPLDGETQATETLPELEEDEITVESNLTGAKNQLFKTADGYELLVWNHSEKTLTVEKYDNSLGRKSASVIDTAYLLPKDAESKDVLLGGIYEGTDYNFVVTGRHNLNEDDSVCTLRVAKFAKDWSFVAACDISNQDDVEIYGVFQACGIDFAEQNGILWISTGRTGYGSGGYHHQGKMNLIVRISDMTLLGSASDFYHSFSQYLTVCNNQVYQYELSEGTRKLLLERLDGQNYTGGWNYNWAAGAEEFISVLDCWSTDEYGMWSYVMHADTVGLSASDTKGRLLTAYVSKDQRALQQNGGDETNLPEEMWVASTTTDLGDTTYTKVSDIDICSYDYYLVKVNDNKFAVLWGVQAYVDYTHSESLSYATPMQYVCVDAYGNRLTDTISLDAELGPYQPVTDGNGNIVWCVDEYNKTIEDNEPVFYTLNTDSGTVTKKNPNEKKTPAPDCNVIYNGIYISKADQTGVTAIMDVQLDGDASGVDYSWYATKDNGATWIRVADWNGNRFINWTPKESGDYILVGKVRKNGDDAGAISKAANFTFHPAIKGICQMPYTGEGGGYLIGVESYDNPGNAYSYEMLILDCTLLAQNKPAWVYTTGQCKTSGSCLWTIWQPQYGYYWTLFRIYDENGTMIDEKCYPFVNAY